MKRKFLKIFGLIGFTLFNHINLRHVHRELSYPVEYLRVVMLRMRGTYIGDNSWVRSGAFITIPDYLSIGNNSTLGLYSRLFLFDLFEIGNEVEIGAGLTVHTNEHHFQDMSLPVSQHVADLAPVKIHDNVYVGSNVTLLSGVEIHSNVVIAAGAVVNRSLESGYIYGGVPAKRIKAL
jgi:acetyltransferase-like isoleucine patch superfamily enzyme